MARKKSSRSRKLRRRLILGSVAAALIGAMAVGAYALYDRGLERENLFEKARSALQAKRYEQAVASFREVLRSEPDLVPARAMLLEALLGAGRLDEAREVAQAQLADAALRSFAAESLCKIALRSRDFDEAERLARLLVGENTDFAYRVLALIQDYRGIANTDWRKRLEAASLQRSLASVTSSDANKAEALIFAASVSLEVAPFLEDPRGLLQRVDEDLREAANAAERAHQADRQYPRDLVVGRIQVLTREDEATTERGAAALRRYATGIDRNDLALIELAKHHIWRKEWNEAVEIARSIEDTYFWTRVFWLVRHAGQLDAALRILDAGPLAEGPERDFLRADLLLSNEERRNEGITLVESIVADGATEASVVLRALVAVALRTDLATARALAERAGVQERDDPRITAFLAALLSADEENKEEGLALAQQLARESATEQGSVLRLLMGGDAAAAESYLEERVEQGGRAGLEARLARAMSLLSRARGDGGDGEAGEALRKRVVGDLEAIAAAADATKPSLLLAFNLASAVGRPELAGRFVGRALTLEGPPAFLDVRLLDLAAAVSDRALLQKLAAGIRSGAADGPAPAYVEAFTRAFEGGLADRTALVRALEEAAREEGSRRFALGLAGRIAFGEEDLGKAEELARLVLRDEPGNAAARELLGAVLLRTGDHGEVLELYGEQREDWPDTAYAHTAGALLVLDRKDEALARARDAMARFPRSLRAHLVLVKVLLAREERRDALSVLSIAPQSEYVVRMRAQLLLEFGDHSMAQQLFETLLRATRYRDLGAWHGLMQVFDAQRRGDAFVARAGAALASGVLEDAPAIVGELHLLRGQAFEREGRVDEALSDYVASLEVQPDNWRSLNNAAWQIATAKPARIDEAGGYIERALALHPDDPILLDTAAEVHAVAGNIPAALERIDAALARATEAKVPGYLVHKARILMRAERDEEAKALLAKVREEHPDTPAASTAKDLALELEMKHVELDDREAEEREAERALAERERQAREEEG